MSHAVRAFQIFYNEETRAALDPDFEPLDNSFHQRQDWHEYWPIREFLRATQLDESAYYGFLSPRFSAKTHLKGKQVRDFVSGVGDADVITFSPYPCQAACFFNVFEQGDFFHPGLAEVSDAFLRQIGLRVDVRALITHSRTTVFSNYFVAKPKFWKLWLEILERLLEAAEGPSSPLQSALTKELSYVRTRDDVRVVQMKVFVMERVASLLLATQQLAVMNFPPFQMPLGLSFRDRMRELTQLDALKVAFTITGDRHYLETFRAVRDRLLKEVGYLRPSATES